MTGRRGKPKDSGQHEPGRQACRSPSMEGVVAHANAVPAVFPLFLGDGSIADRAAFDRAYADPIERIVKESEGQWLQARTIAIEAGETYSAAAAALSGVLDSIRPRWARYEMEGLSHKFWQSLHEEWYRRGALLQPIGKFKQLAGALATTLTAAFCPVVAARRVITNIQALEEARQAGAFTTILDRRPNPNPADGEVGGSSVPGPAFESMLWTMRNCGGFSALEKHASDLNAMAVTSEARELLRAANEELKALATVTAKDRLRTKGPTEARSDRAAWRRRIVGRLMRALQGAFPDVSDDRLIQDRLGPLLATVEAESRDAMAPASPARVVSVSPPMMWEVKLRECEQLLEAGAIKDIERLIRPYLDRRLTVSGLRQIVRRLKSEGELPSRPTKGGR